MTYNKPAIDVLGEATCVIQGSKGGAVTDPPISGSGTVGVPTPAYELDE
jgi:hypothetical protein